MMRVLVPSSLSRPLRRAIAVPVAALAVLGLASCTMAPPITTTVPSVDLNRYLGTWYEVGSV